MQQNNADRYRRQTQQNDLKQHAVKIIHGIKKIGPSESKRAIWELFQNAIDLSEKSHIEINITDSEFVFSHNGIPFTMMTLDCLFTQVSSKTLSEIKTEKEDGDAVGQYGTGFMTTHSFGNIIDVDGAIVINGDSDKAICSSASFIPFKQLTLDRSTQNWITLSDNIRDLRGEVEKLLNEEEKYGTLPQTTFKYRFTNDSNKKRALDAVESLSIILPYVMTFNEKLQSVLVTDINGNVTSYIKENDAVENGVYFSQPIKVNDSKTTVNFIKSEKIKIALPLNNSVCQNGYIGCATEFPDALSRLFLFYPLIGSEKFGFNYVLHSRNFMPTEKRDGLFLNSDNENNQKEEEANQRLIKEASNLIFNFLEENLSKIENPHFLSRINFLGNSDMPELNDYFADLKTDWINKFKSLQFVKTQSERITVEDAYFVHPDIIRQSDQESLRAIYNVVLQFFNNIPKFELAAYWANIIDEWNDDNIRMITFDDIADKIEESDNISEFHVNDLVCLYKEIIQQEQSDIFNGKAILPNIKGDFRKHIELSQSVDLTEKLIEIADIINPSISNRQIDDRFLLEGLEFESFARKQYIENINISLDDNIFNSTTSGSLPEGYIENLIRYSSIVSSKGANNVPIRLVELIAQFYQIEFYQIVIPVSDENDKLDVRKGQNNLFRVYLNDISEKSNQWVKDNIEPLAKILKTAFESFDHKEFFKRFDVYPNQEFELKAIEELYNGSSIKESIKELYDDVVNESNSVRSILANKVIEDLYDDMKCMKSTDLTRKIEKGFFGEDESIIKMTGHIYRMQIIEILQKFKDSNDSNYNTIDYSKLFPVTYRLRSNILVQLADGDSSFKILSQDEDKIKMLAELAEIDNLDELIDLGRDALKKKHQEEKELRYKKHLGEHLENILRVHLSDSLNLTVNSEQNGQDLVLYIEEEPAYYIEVKSKWLDSTPIRISKNQTIRAHQNPNCFVLCSINMVDYDEADRAEVESIDKITNRMKFNTDVGQHLDDLIPLYESLNLDDKFRIDGDLRTYIPLKYIKAGLDLSEFEQHLIQYLKENHGN